MLDELVPLLEAAFVEQEPDAFPRGELALQVLLVNTVLAAAEKRGAIEAARDRRERRGIGERVDARVRNLGGGEIRRNLDAAKKELSKIGDKELSKVTDKDLKARVDFPITAGITYYIAHAGYLGSVMCEDYTCYGWGINLASRFMMSAAIGETWMDDRIARRVSKRFEIEFLGCQLFKGFAVEQKVHRLCGRGQMIELAYQGEFVGRDAELAHLAKFIEPVWQKKFAGLLLVSGDAGLGKSRLVYEFRSSKMFGGKKILWALCPSDQILRQPFNVFA